MNELLTTTLYAAGDVQAAGIFDTIESVAGSAKDTVLVVFGALFYIGAIYTSAKAKFSAGSIMVGLLMVGLGTAVLSQVEGISNLFSETIDEETAQSQQAAAPTDLWLDEPLVIVVEDLAQVA